MIFISEATFLSSFSALCVPLVSMLYYKEVLTGQSAPCLPDEKVSLLRFTINRLNNEVFVGWIAWTTKHSFSGKQRMLHILLCQWRLILKFLAVLKTILFVVSVKWRNQCYSHLEVHLVSKKLHLAFKGLIAFSQYFVSIAKFVSFVY